MGKFRVGLFLHQQHATYGSLVEAVKRADDMGVDSVWLGDHFFPLYGDPDGEHLEAYTLLAALAVQTNQTELGLMVSCNSYRTPNLLADMIRTIDHISGGRAILGIGSGWFERDYTEYGYEFGTAGSRLKALEAALPVIIERLGKLNPPPVRQPLPILIGGGGEKVTLRLVAKHASMWNVMASPEDAKRKNDILDGYCAEIGRDPAEIERTIAVGEDNLLKSLDEMVEAGMTHMIQYSVDPVDFGKLAKLVAWRERM